jgi:hypothetical protein
MRDNYLMGSYMYDGPFFKIPLSMKAVLFIDSKQGNINDNWSKAMELVYKDTGIRVIDNVHIKTICINGVVKAFH